MDLVDLVNPSVLKQPVYEPGRPIDDVARELGLDPNTVIKLASNENPLGTSPKALEAMKAALADSALYPDGGCQRLREKLANRHGLQVDQIVVGNGSNEIIELLGHVFLRPGDEVVMGTSAFIVYKLVTLLFGASPVEVPLVDFRHDLEAMKAAVTDRTKLVFLPCPNNPTGTKNEAAEVIAFARSLPDHVVFVLDEAYAEYLEQPVDLTPLIAEGRRVICLRTFSKVFGLAGLRIGYGYATPAMAAVLHRVRQPFNVNAVAQAAACAAVEDEEWVRRCRTSNAVGLRQLGDGLRDAGFVTVPSCANFLLIKVGCGREVFELLQRTGVIVRPVDGYGLPEWIRATVGTEEENNRLLTELIRCGLRGDR